MVKGFKWIRVGTQKMCCGVWCAGVSGLWGVVLSHKLRWTGTNRSKRVVKLQQTTRNRRPENQKHLFESQHDFIEEKLPARCWFLRPTAEKQPPTAPPFLFWESSIRMYTHFNLDIFMHMRFLEIPNLEWLRPQIRQPNCLNWTSKTRHVFHRWSSGRLTFLNCVYKASNVTSPVYEDNWV